MATWKFVVNALFFTLSIFLKNIMLLLNCNIKTPVGVFEVFG